jgi:hypothetical protein
MTPISATLRRLRRALGLGYTTEESNTAWVEKR